ncbi:Two-component system sensor histidine kinase [hydrothermal vent metagenome]|uniref:histidine kinase n=1 Tax=hydrothermal vent metagenome TaxID=652676 RepID=A0A3B0XAA9_9ZZZZ
MNLGLYSYLAAGFAYSFFAVLLLFSWRESLQGKLLFFCVFASACWGFTAAQIALHDESYLVLYQSLEVLRYIVWYMFLFKLFDAAISGGNASESGHQKKSYQNFIRWAKPLSIGFATVLLLSEIFVDVLSVSGQFVFGIAGNVVLSLIGLTLLEQLFRNTSARHRWATKYLFLGAGGIFVFDFYLYTDALLFRNIDQDLWSARGVVHMLSVPLLAVSSARNKNWSLNIFVSRDIILNTTVILGGGFYLLAMAGAGYYLRIFGGDWGKVAQIMFLTLAIIFMFVILSSSQLRAKARVFLSKHFYKNKYDYRIEWLRLTEDLNNKSHNEDHFRTAIEAMANIVEARAGSLWLRDDKGDYKNSGVWQSVRLDDGLTENDSLIKFLIKTGFVVNLKDYSAGAKEYKKLSLPEWMLDDDLIWLIVPLHGVDGLLGFVVLSSPLVERSINWEDRDLLKTAAKQVTSYLTVLMTSSQLAEAKQFEVFSRLSAYMVHDLKNIAAELELIAINAKKHTSNPEFVKDAFGTVENAADDIKRLLMQLRNRRAEKEKKVLVDLIELVTEVVKSKQHILPAPQLRVESGAALVPLEKGRLMNVLAHLIENAQQATSPRGEIILTLSKVKDMRVIEIKDSGQGMDNEFIRNRLFKPFDTTKGNAGMGIGMYESREFIRQLGGDIYVKSKPEKGTIITLHIPFDLSGDDIDDVPS